MADDGEIYRDAVGQRRGLDADIDNAELENGTTIMVHKELRMRRAGAARKTPVPSISTY
jgi:hypothetical protein